MNWAQISNHFRDDGSLRDVYVLETSLNDWAGVWRFLSSEPKKLAFEIDGKATPPPANVEAVFELSAEHSVTASYVTGKQRLNCHFFSQGEVEFDLDPRDVDGPAEVERLALFLARLGRATSKEVRLTSENEREAIIARYDPKRGGITWMPPAL